jgi:uroporphyrinogen III methyltransferase / synthase
VTVRVLLTRAAGGNDELARRLLRLPGLEPVECPLIRIEPLEGPPLDASGYDWVVLTSRVGVRLFFGRLQGEPPRLAVVGPGTAEAVRAHGAEPALVARRSTQEGLLEELPPDVGRVLFAGAEDARPLLARALHADVVSLYRTIEDPPAELPEADLVVLASASAARSLAAVAGERPACVSIGPVTTEAARDAELDVVAEAPTHDVEGLVRAVKLAASRVQSSRF